MSQFVKGPMASALPVAIAAGMVLAVPPAAAQESASAQCTDQAASAANSRSAAAPQVVSHDLRTNVVARTGGAATSCADHAISTKGTGAAGRSAGGDDCDDRDDDCDAGADDAASTEKVIKTNCIKVSASQSGQTLRSSMAINTKGTGAAGKAEAAPDGTPTGVSGDAAAGKYSAPINVTATCTIK